MSGEFSFFEQKDAQEAVGRALYALIPEGADRVVLQMSVLRPVLSGTTQAFFPDGREESLGMGVHIDYKLLDHLREVMYKPGVGTWFWLEVTVTARGEMSIRFNYDDEPGWDGTPVDPVAYVNDARVFPRDVEHQPEWLKQRLAEGEELIRTQKWARRH